MSDKYERNVPGPGPGSERQSETDDPQISLPEDMDIELMEAFIAESSDLINNSKEALLSLEKDPQNMEAIDTVFRVFHNIKGTSGFFEISIMTEMAHYMESFLGLIRSGKICYTAECADLILRTTDMLKVLFRSLQEAICDIPFLKPKGYDELLRTLTESTNAKKSLGTDRAGTRSAQKHDISEKPASVPEQPDDISKDMTTARPVRTSPPEKKEEDILFPTPEQSFDDETRAEEAASLMNVAQGLRTRQHEEIGKPQSAESSVRVSVERLDRFIDMVGELVVSHSMVAQDDLISEGTHHDLFKKVSHTSKIVRDLQNMSMSMRMVPLKATFRKMARLVRDLARRLNKKVTFISEGEDTEVDRNMVDVINDPLIHIIRNAVDHGIEPSEFRKDIGKSPYGIVKLSAYHSAGNVVMKIEDDGQGFDRDAILAKAVERGLINKESVERGDMISEQQVFNLIFQPGFSTSSRFSQVSGRGMGMDVVRKNIESLRGQMDVKSIPKKGSVFKISLPLTLAIIDGMVVRVGKERYVMPTISIVRSVRPKPEDISTVLHQGKMLSVQKKLVPLFRLADIFEINDAEQDPARAIAVIIEDDRHQAGLLVDELIGSQQIVIKPLGETIRNIRGISGSAIMPDGKVGLILDVSELVAMTNAKHHA